MEVKIAYPLKLPVSFIRTSLKFTFRDKRKRVAFLLVAFIPVLGNIWKFIPQDIPFPHYQNLDVFIFTFTGQFILVVIGVAWFLIIGRKDFGLQILALALIAYGVFTTYSTLPLSKTTSVWFDLLVTMILTFFLSVFLYYTQTNTLHGYDYKAQCEDMIHDLHHSRFLGRVCRIEGLLHISEMPEAYKGMTLREVQELKDNIKYIGEKYENLT